MKDYKEMEDKDFKDLLLAHVETQKRLIDVNLRVLKRIKYLSIIAAIIIFCGIIFWSHVISNQILHSKTELNKMVKQNVKIIKINQNDIGNLKKELVNANQSIKDLEVRISLQRFYINMNTQTTNKNVSKSIKDSIEMDNLKEQIKILREKR